MNAKRFFHIAAGLFLLVAAYAVGAVRVQGQATSNRVLASFVEAQILRASVVACLLTILSIFSFSDATANLLVNGGFETGPSNGPPGYVAMPLNSTACTGWIVTESNVDHISTLWQPSEGTHSIDLSGVRPGALAQTIETQSGATYQVNFAMAGNVGAPPTVKTMRLSAAESFADFTFDTTGRSLASMGWVGRSWSFVANSSSTTIEFRSMDSPGTMGGPALDDVMVDLVSTDAPLGATFGSRMELAIRPNPARDGGLIRLGLPDEQQVVLAVFDLNGRLVRELTAARFSPGMHEFRWDGRGDNGRSIASGIYFVRVQTGNQTATTRVLLMR